MTSTNQYISLMREYKFSHASEYGIMVMGIFGSVARGEQTANSDVDVFVQLREPDLFAMAGIKLELEEIYHQSVDVINYNENMNAFLKQQIDKDAVYA